MKTGCQGANITRILPRRMSTVLTTGMHFTAPSRIRRTLIALLDGLMVLNLFLILAVMVTGGWSGQVGRVSLAAHSTGNPSLVFSLLLVLRLLAGRHVAAPKSPVTRLFTWVLSRVAVLNAARPLLCLWSLAGAYFMVMSVVVVRRHLSLNSHAFDLGIFDQALWALTHGEGLWSSILGRHLLGEHFSPVMYAVGLGYRLWPDPMYLLVLQTAVLAAGALPLWWLVRQELGSPHWALLFSFLYLCYQPVRNVNLYDFHEIALTTPLLLGAFYYLNKRRYVVFAAFLLTALLCREEITQIMLVFGCYMMLAHGRRWIGASVAISGVILFLVLILAVIPHFRGGPYPFLERYSYLGLSIPEILGTLLMHPLHVLQHVVTRAKLEYAWRVFAPLAFLSFLSPVHLLLALPTFLQNILSDFSAQYSIDFQYTAPLTPFVFVSAVFGLKNLLTHHAQFSRYSRWTRRVGPIPVAVILLILMLVHFGESPASQLRRFAPNSHERFVRFDFLPRIPATASVSAQDALVPHLAHRARINQFPAVHDADYVVLDSSGPTWPVDGLTYLAKVWELLSGRYRVDFARAPLLLLRKRDQATPTPLTKGFAKGKRAPLE